MSHFFFEIAIFGSKVLILLFVFGLIMFIIGTVLSEHKKMKKKKLLQIEDMGEQMEIFRLKTQSMTLPSKEIKKQIKQIKKQKQKKEPSSQKCVYVLDFKGDMKASEVQHLREEISILIKSANEKKDEVVLRLNNGGGLVYTHGLGASQLQRLRDKGFYLTVCVDEVAGSGGYLMASVANKIIAAPFAAIGSIGVLAQIPNFHRFLQKQDVDFEEHYAGDHKRTLTVFGKTTDEKREKLRQQLEEIHLQFKNYVTQYRPHLDLKKTATGEHWLGIKAKELGLVDEISTSDNYILSLMENRKVFHFSLKEEEPKGLHRLLSKKIDQIAKRYLNYM